MVYLEHHNHVVSEGKTSLLTPMQSPASQQKNNRFLSAAVLGAADRIGVHLGVASCESPSWRKGEQ